MTNPHTGHANGDTQTAATREPFHHCGGRHGLADVVGYNVRQTFARGETLRDPIVIQRFEGAGSYLEAQDLKRSIKVVADDKIVAWAVVTPLYSDGCEGMPY